MSILHMETDVVKHIGQQMQLTTTSMQQNSHQLSATVQSLTAIWQSPAAAQFSREMDRFFQQMSNLVGHGEQLSQRLQHEVQEWEQVAATFASSGSITFAIKEGLHITESGQFPQEEAGQPEFRLNADALINYDPAFVRDELGTAMKEINAHLSASLAQGTYIEDPELIQNMAAALDIEYAEAEAQYQKLFEILSKNGENDVQDLSTVYDLKGHWGSRRQLLFGKVVGDSLGLDPAFAALLSPSGGLIGPGDGAMTVLLDGNLSGIVNENAWDYHGAAHDAAGYLYNNHKIGPGYEYIDNETLNIGFDTKNPLSGQLSGYLFWAQKMGVSETDLQELVIKARLLPLGGWAFL